MFDTLPYPAEPRPRSLRQDPCGRLLQFRQIVFGRDGVKDGGIFILQTAEADFLQTVCKAFAQIADIGLSTLESEQFRKLVFEFVLGERFQPGNLPFYDFFSISFQGFHLLPLGC